MNLNFPGNIPAADIVGRLLGPDLFDSFVQATAAEYDPETDKTRVRVRPVPPAELGGMTRDRFGQWRLPLPERFGGAR